MLDQQLKQEIADAKNKSNLLFNVSNEALNVIANIYNSSEGGQSQSNSAPPPASNPFAVSMGAATTPNANSIFGGSTSMSNSGSLFGNATASSNPFANNAGGFGNNNQNASSIFGGASSTAAAPNNANLFSNANNATTAGGSIFGSSSFGASAGGGSIFGGAQSKPSVFGQAAAAPGPFSQQSTGSPFSLNQIGQQQQSQMTQPQASSIFGKSAQTNQVFGGPPTFSSKPTGLFSQANAALAAQNPSNVFGQASAFGTPVSQNSVFSGGAQAQTIFGQAMQQIPASHSFSAMNTQPKSIFGTASMATGATVSTQSQPSNVFGSPNAFGTASTTTMGSSMFGGNMSAQTQQPASIFGSAQVQQPSMQQSMQPSMQQSMQTMQPTQPSMFAQQPPGQQPMTLQQQQQSIFGGSSFASAGPAPGSSIFGGALAQQQQAVIAVTAYSKLEELNAAEVEAFQAGAFELGRIPTMPPARELCV